LSLHAEALVKQPTLESLAEETESQKRLLGEGDKPVAFVFGPEHGAVSHKLVENAAIEARRKDYTHLPAGPNKTIAVKVVDDRGNELLVTKRLDNVLGNDDHETHHSELQAVR
jgi:hypothetical protein